MVIMISIIQGSQVNLDQNVQKLNQYKEKKWNETEVLKTLLTLHNANHLAKVSKY